MSGKREASDDGGAPGAKRTLQMGAPASPLSQNQNRSQSRPAAGDSAGPSAVEMTPGTRAFNPEVNTKMKYIVVSGGVCSSLGKGVTTSSLGALLRAHGYRVTAIKLDPYINVDAGLMSPYEHGEVYVLDDGGETDLDLGNYERWMNLSLTRDHNITTGKVYERVIQKERKGQYLGKTVQVIPHVTSEMRRWIDEVAKISCDGGMSKPQICLIELGGTVGDIESAAMIEALRQHKFGCDEHCFAWCHCTYLPFMSGLKTKPTQHTVRSLLGLGIQADLIVCRSSEPLDDATRTKISNQCNVKKAAVLSAHNVSNLCHVPDILHRQGVIETLTNLLHLEALERKPTPLLAAPGLRATKAMTIDDWRKYAKKVDDAKASEEVRIGVVGKYVKGGEDAYASCIQALDHAATECGRRIAFEWIQSDQLAPDKEAHGFFGSTVENTTLNEADRLRAETQLRNCHGVFVPGGFGARGVEGKIRAAALAREWKKPYLGICLGMQVAAVSFARDVVSVATGDDTYRTGNSAEFDRSAQVKVLEFLPGMRRDRITGAGMRLGQERLELAPGDTIARALYGGASAVYERHRHRFEFNNSLCDAFTAAGMQFTGWGQGEKGSRDKSKLVGAIELPRTGHEQAHPFYLGVQYHPEYKSRPGHPSPPYYGFLAAACAHHPDTGATDSAKIAEMLQAELSKGPRTSFTEPALTAGAL
eukprot:TRINITY_DN19369_c0_g1_i1.p1 TRINITY_DN19369_c0_g1~~TRINITY_DN19369_c0_g1_i1.p1  ORF type:complete len:734 (+),score=214.81 TRINITY_DN19369_c0_g1_i1:96-2204(+)